MAPPDDLDVDLDSAGGPGWIDDAGRRAQGRLAADSGSPIIGHADWEMHNLEWDGPTPVAVHDWDSLAISTEPALAGAAARRPRIVGGRSGGRLARPERALPGRLPATRSATWPADDLELAWAAGVWVLAYNAKKEVAGGGSGYLPHLEPEVAERLRRAGAERLSGPSAAAPPWPRRGETLCPRRRTSCGCERSSAAAASRLEVASTPVQLIAARSVPLLIAASTAQPGLAVVHGQSEKRQAGGRLFDLGEGGVDRVGVRSTGPSLPDPRRVDQHAAARQHVQLARGGRRGGLVVAGGRRLRPPRRRRPGSSTELDFPAPDSPRQRHCPVGGGSDQAADPPPSPTTPARRGRGPPRGRRP